MTDIHACSHTIAIPTDPYGDGVRLFNHNTVTFEPGVTVLVGCNGSGKTTLMHLVREAIEEDGRKCLCYDNLYDGGKNALDAYSFHNQIELLATGMTSSEGENIRINLGQMAGKIGWEIAHWKRTPGTNELWIFLDSVDSGFSIDNIIELDSLFDLIIDDAKSKDINVFILTAANEYELVRRGKPFDVKTGKYIDIPDYESYYSFIMESSHKKEKRLEKMQKHNSDID